MKNLHIVAVLIAGSILLSGCNTDKSPAASSGLDCTSPTSQHNNQHCADQKSLENRMVPTKQPKEW